MLTEKQQDVYSYILKCKKEIGCYPSLGDIKNYLPEKITAQAVAARIKWIEKKGYLIHKGKRDYKILK